MRLAFDPAADGEDSEAKEEWAKKPEGDLNCPACRGERPRFGGAKQGRCAIDAVVYGGGPPRAGRGHRNGVGPTMERPRAIAS